MRVAWIAPYFPGPENTGGRIRMAQLARAVAKDATVDLFCSGGREEYANEKARPDGAVSFYGQCFVEGRRPSMYILSPFEKVHERVRSATPLTLYYHLNREHKKRPYDLAVVCHSYAMGLVRAAGDCPIILDEHNVESDYATQTDSARTPENLRANLKAQHASLEDWEKLSWQRAAHVTCVCEQDAGVISQTIAREKVTVIANGSTVRSIRWIAPSERAKQGRDTIVFVGLMSHAPNEQASEWMAREVMPLLWKTLPNAKLVLCGRQPSDLVKSLANDRVIVTGTVDSVASYLNEARVLINPLHHGAGSSLKAVEALACGAPVVSTTVGMRGIAGTAPSVTHEQADDPQAFADAIRSVWERSQAGDPSLDAQAQNARSVAERYDWSTIGESFAQLVHKIHTMRKSAK